MDWEVMGARGRTGSDGLLRVGCEERLGENLTGKGGERIEWGETRSAPVAERVEGSSVRRRQRDGHSYCSQKNRSEQGIRLNPWKIAWAVRRGSRHRPGSRRRSIGPDCLGE